MAEGKDAIAPGEILYDGEGIKITRNQKNPEDHNLWIGDSYFYLQRGVLEEVAVSDVRHVIDMMHTMSAGVMDFSLNNSRLAYSDLAVAFSQARIEELEGMLADAIQNPISG